jgi:mannose-6-phosphate isomerase-like protein (cupin superfamily)
MTILRGTAMWTADEPISVDGVTWFGAAPGERQAVRVDGRTTGGTYSVIESVAQPGCAAPTHLHRNEEEHFLVISGRYRIAVGDKIFDAAPGTRITVPRDAPHSWRNVAEAESRLLAIITPGGLEQVVCEMSKIPPDQIPALAARFGCELLGPPVG